MARVYGTRLASGDSRGRRRGVRGDTGGAGLQPGIWSRRCCDARRGRSAVIRSYDKPETVRVPAREFSVAQWGATYGADVGMRAERVWLSVHVSPGEGAGDARAAAAWRGDRRQARCGGQRADSGGAVAAARSPLTDFTEADPPSGRTGSRQPRARRDLHREPLARAGGQPRSGVSSWTRRRGPSTRRA